MSKYNSREEWYLGEIGAKVREAVEKSDFKLWETGGGCTAFGHTEENEDYILITGIDCDAPMTEVEQCVVGLYDKHGENLEYWETKNIYQALHAAKWWVMEYYIDQEKN